MKKTSLTAGAALVTLVFAAPATVAPSSDPPPASAPGQPADAARQDALARSLATISAAAVRGHVEFLADDLLEGRQTGTRGYEIAARYVAAQMARLGLKPGGSAGTWFQPVPLVESRLREATVSLRGETGSPVSVELRRDCIMSGDVHQDEARIEAPVVFAGFGISAADLQHDDYANLDVRNHIVVVLTNAPARFPTEQRAHHASSRLKMRLAADRGAIGILFVRTAGDERRMPWARYTAASDLTSVAWIDAEGVPADVPPGIRAAAMLGPEAARTLFSQVQRGNGQETRPGLERILAEAEAGAPKGFALGVTASISTKSERRRITSPNVAGILEGSDPGLRDTYVVYSAHLDHVGVGEPVDGDRIYNGAYDNAMGTGILLEAARALTGMSPRPRRSILFLFVTAEERGLVGSDYFARYPTVPRPSIVANVNVDMPLLLFPLRQAVAFGAENSTLGTFARRAAELADLTLIPDPIPEENLFIRSDQYSFVRQGVPAVFFVPGFVSSDPSIDGQQQFGRFIAEHYHRPSDDLRLPVDAGSVERFTRANAALGYLIANAPEAPAWAPGNFFGRTFAGTR